MQNLALSNVGLAHEYLNAAYALCKSDPLLLNELGVVFYHQEHMSHAISVFEQALQLAEEVGAEPSAWVATRANLGHALRRVGRLEEALRMFEEVLRQGGKDAAVFCAKGLVLLEMGDAWQAVVALHEALAVSPQDPVATELLGKALEANEGVAIMGLDEEEEFERRIEGARMEGLGRGGRTRRERRSLESSGIAFEGDSMAVDEDDDV